MADLYNAHAIVITEETITVGTKTKLMDGVLRAEPYQVMSWFRAAVIFLFGCILPIAAMVLFVQVDAIPAMKTWFGPVLTIISIGLGCVAGALGIYWQKPWAVVIEEEEGFNTLTKTPNKDVATQVSDAINGVVEPEAVGNYEV